MRPGRTVDAPSWPRSSPERRILRLGGPRAIGRYPPLRRRWPGLAGSPSGSFGEGRAASAGSWCLADWSVKVTSWVSVITAVRSAAWWERQYRLVRAMTWSGGGAPQEVWSVVLGGVGVGWCSPGGSGAGYWVALTVWR